MWYNSRTIGLRPLCTKSHEKDRMISHIIIALIFTRVGYFLRMIVVNHQIQVWEHAVIKCNKARTKFFRGGGDEARKEWKKTTKNEVEVKDMRLTEEELHTVWDFATNTPNTPQLEINPCWLISMVEEIRVHRSAMQKSVGMRLMELDQKTRCDLVYIVGCAMNTTDPEVFSDCLETIAEMIFPELVGEIKFHKD